MADNINDELAALFADTPCVIENNFNFMKKLNIGDEHLTYLNNSKNLVTVVESLLGGAGIGGLTAVGWYSTLGIGGKLLFGLSLTAPPIGWVVGASALGAAGVFGLKKAKNKYVRKAEDALITKVPKYLNTPLDLLGLSLATLMLPVSVKMAQADGEFCTIEREQISKYFIDQWGYNGEFISKLTEAQETKIDSFSYKDYAKTIKAVCSKTKEFKHNQLTEEILDFQREIILMDGKVHPKEEQELAALRIYLQ